MPRRQWLLAAAGLALVPLLPVMAVPVAAQAASEVTAPISLFGDALQGVTRAGSGTPFVTRFQMLSPVIGRAFSISQLVRACVGPRFDSFSPADQAALTETFAHFTIASWVANFTGSAGDRLVVAPDIRTVGNDQVVQASLGGQRIDFVMRQTGQGWQVVDVLLDGSISQVAVQRSDFRAVLAGGAPALIASLRQKISDLSGGALTS